jgi:protein-S-isoprenylcysteine O-methyltransferase Ste14
LIFPIAFYQCIEIVKINNQAQDSKNQPKKLLDDGYYAKVRHPMTARFFIIVLSFFFMLSSFIGIPLIVLFAFIFTIITLYEEKKILFPTFGEKYTEYMKKVKYRFFTFKMKLLVLLLIIFLIFGVILI